MWYEMEEEGVGDHGRSRKEPKFLVEDDEDDALQCELDLRCG